jgi:WD40 repeat protein
MHRNWVSSVAFHSEYPIVATGSHDCWVRVWSVDDGGGAACIAILRHSDWVGAIAFHPALPLLVAGCYDMTVTFWWIHWGSHCELEGNRMTCTTSRHPDIASTSRVAVLKGHSSSVASVAFHPRLPVLATIGQGHAAMLWR